MDVGRTRNWPASKEFARAEVYLALPPHNAPGGLRGAESAAAAAPGGEDDCDADSLVGGRYGTLKDAMMPSWPWYCQVWLRKWAAESVRAMAGNRSFGTRRSRLPVPSGSSFCPLWTRRGLWSRRNTDGMPGSPSRLAWLAYQRRRLPEMMCTMTAMMVTTATAVVRGQACRMRS